MSYQLDTSPTPCLWRDQDVGNLMPDDVSSKQMDDKTGRKLLLCAKKRFDSVRGIGRGTDYSGIVVPDGDLKGLCFVAADEMARYLSAQGERAKAVRVRPAGRNGGDHYFTVVNNGNRGNSAIVDNTWYQFDECTKDKPFCLVGTLGAIRFVLGFNSNMVSMYDAGLDVLAKWDNYECFSG